MICMLMTSVIKAAMNCIIAIVNIGNFRLYFAVRKIVKCIKLIDWVISGTIYQWRMIALMNRAIRIKGLYSSCKVSCLSLSKLSLYKLLFHLKVNKYAITLRVICIIKMKLQLIKFRLSSLSLMVIPRYYSEF